VTIVGSVVIAVVASIHPAARAARIGRSRFTTVAAADQAISVAWTRPRREPHARGRVRLSIYRRERPGVGAGFRCANAGVRPPAPRVQRW
jgi:hypothetical protein